MTRRSSVTALRRCTVLWAIASLAACSSSSSLDGAGGAGGGGAGGGVPVVLPDGGGGGKSGGDGGGPAPTFDANCGNSASTMTQLPADLLLVLDRSGTMTNGIADDNPCDTGTGLCAQRWATMIQAMQTVLAGSPASIQWGLKFFSTPGLTQGLGTVPAGCVVLPDMEVPMGGGNGNAIVGAIANTTPNYNTPTRAAIETSVAYLSALGDGRTKYVLLATDGEPNCKAGGEYATTPDLEAALAAISAAKAAGILVYVIGVGPSAGNLGEMARQGGTGAFYPALSPQSLIAALNAIVGTIASCVYTMTTPPPDPNNLGVYLDKHLVPPSASDGWVLSSGNSVTFTGPTCDRIKAGAYRDVQVLFGCPGSPELPTWIP
jgi:hypothetical protein